jgi:hypothetical protein
MWGFALIAVGTTLQVVGVVMTSRQAPRVAQASASGSAEVADTGRARPAESTAGSIGAPTKVKKQRRRWLNPLGLILGMIGVVLIFFWGPPQPSFEGASLSYSLNPDYPMPDKGGKTVAEFNAEQAATKELYQHISQLGLGFVFVGFGCQLIAVWPRRSD